jgi:hypothetical protein
METGVARIQVDPALVAQNTRTLIYERDYGPSLNDNWVLESAG